MVDKTAKILVVDDDANLRDLLNDTLNAIGYTVDAAADGGEALEALEHNTYDLVITDIKMPGINGVQLLRKVRRLFPDLPVLFITGVVSPEIIGRASPDGFLAKPFRISHMERLIEDALAGTDEQVPQPIRNVLVVDDDDMFRQMLADTLRYNNYVATAVEDGTAALRELQDGIVDAVITDIKMPGMDGIALLKSIKEQFPETPVILITAYYSENQVDQSSDVVQANGFLRKPFQVEEIIRLLERLSPTEIPSDS